MPDGHDSDDIAVNKAETALRAAWNMLQVADDLREQGHIANAEMAVRCANRAYAMCGLR